VREAGEHTVGNAGAGEWVPAQRTPPPSAPRDEPAPAAYDVAPAGRRSLLALLVAHGAATAGQTTAGLAAGVYAMDRGGGAGWLSATIALSVLPYVVLSGAAGALADRHPRDRVLAWSCAARALGLAGLGTAIVVDAPVGTVVALTALTAVAATPAYPALAAAVPQCVDDVSLARANSWATGVENLSWIAGPGLFGLLTLLGCGPREVVVVAMIACALATGVALSARLPGVPATTAGRRTRGSALTAGLRTVASHRRLRGAMGLAVLDNLLYGYLVVALVLLVRDMGGTDGDLGRLNASLTIGALLAVLAGARWAHRLPASIVVPVGLAGFVGALVLVAVLAPGLDGGGGPGGVVASYAVAGAVLLAGAATLLAEVGAVTLLQRGTASDVLARVFGAYDQLNVGALALGSALAAPLGALLGAPLALAVVAVVTLPVMALLLPAARAGAVGSGPLDELDDRLEVRPTDGGRAEAGDVESGGHTFEEGSLPHPLRVDLGALTDGVAPAP
jgi:MFS family permease